MPSEKLDDMLYLDPLMGAIDRDAETLERLWLVSGLMASLNDLQDELAAQALKQGAPLREVAEHARVGVGTAHRRWGTANPRAHA